MRIAFITSTPLNVTEGSGTYSAVATLAAALRGLGVEVEFVTPQFGFPIYTARRLWFNEQLRARRWQDFDLLVGFDMDGYRIAAHAGRPHIASIKGVIADEMRFERGITRLTMSLQARCEAAHVRRAGLVLTTSRYAASRIQQLYGIRETPRIVPDAIDLTAWRDLFGRNPVQNDSGKFTVFTVCRFYPRKRLHLLLSAAARLRGQIPGLEFRVAGDGPEHGKLRAIWRENHLEGTVQWLGDISQDDLAREYNRCDLFALPSVQEGFGIVFLEAMAAGKPIVAARTAAVPEVVEQGLLVEPESEAALADGILSLYRDPQLRAQLAAEGKIIVARYDAPRVARMFLSEVGAVK